MVNTVRWHAAVVHVAGLPGLTQENYDLLPFITTVLCNFHSVNQFQAGSGQQPATQQYVVHKDFLGTPFQLDSSSGELIVSESLQKEGTLSMYDIVIVADQGQNKAWTVTTIVIGEIVCILIPNHPCLYSTFS